jgi:hypothetical protein
MQLSEENKGTIGVTEEKFHNNGGVSRNFTE